MYKHAVTWHIATKEEAWAKCRLALGLHFLTIHLQGPDHCEDKDYVKDDVARTKLVCDTWAKLVGELYLLIDQLVRMREHIEAKAMQQILDNVVEYDVRDVEVADMLKEIVDLLNPPPPLQPKQQPDPDSA